MDLYPGLGKLAGRSVQKQGQSKSHAGDSDQGRFWGENRVSVNNAVRREEEVVPYAMSRSST